jgi:hypothetical protein
MPEPIFTENPFDTEPPEIPSIITAFTKIISRPVEMESYALAFKMHEIPETHINIFFGKGWHIHDSFMHESNVLLILSRPKEKSSNA